MASRCASALAAALLARFRVPALVLVTSGVLAIALHVLVGLRIGYGPDHPAAERYAAFGLLLVAPALLDVCSTRVGARLVPALAPAPAWLPAVAVTWGSAVLVIPALDAPPWVLIVVAVLLAAALTGVRLGVVTASTPARATWLRVLTGAGSVAQPVLAVAVVLLDSAGQPTLRAVAQNSVAHVTVPLPLVVLPALAWAAPSAVATIRLRQSGWAWVTQAAVLLALARAVADAPPVVQLTVLLMAFAGSATLAAVGGHRNGPFWSSVEVAAVLFGAVYATAAAVLATVDLSAGYRRHRRGAAAPQPLPADAGHRGPGTVRGTRPVPAGGDPRR